MDAVKVVPIERIVDLAVGVGSNNRRGKEVDVHGLSAHFQFDRIEAACGIGPLERSDQFLIPVTQQLPAHGQGQRCVFGRSNFHVCLSKVDRIAKHPVGGSWSNPRSPGILALKEEPDLRMRPNPDVDSGPGEAIAIIHAVRESQTSPALETKTENATEIKPVGCSQ